MKRPEAVHRARWRGASADRLENASVAVIPGKL